MAQDVKFNLNKCFIPPILTPCTPNTDGMITIINQGDAGYCVIEMQIKDEANIIWNGHLETGETMQSQLTLHLPRIDYPESEVITITFNAGYLATPNNLIITDQLEEDISVQVDEIDIVAILLIACLAVGGIGITYGIYRSR